MTSAKVAIGLLAMAAVLLTASAFSTSWGVCNEKAGSAFSIGLHESETCDLHGSVDDPIPCETMPFLDGPMWKHARMRARLMAWAGRATFALTLLTSTLAIAATIALLLRRKDRRRTTWIVAATLFAGITTGMVAIVFCGALRLVFDDEVPTLGGAFFAFWIGWTAAVGGAALGRR